MLSSRANVSSRCSGRRTGGPSFQRAVIARATPAELPRWPAIFKALTNARVESVSAQEAKRRVDSGEWVLVDVRLTEQFETGHPEGAVSVPIYEVGGWVPVYVCAWGRGRGSESQQDFSGSASSLVGRAGV
ncbi:hypothetical protein TSOC_012204 [Tetrabaena socialis]|uniref:Rhodanese domain-containing protein n=1 Tax=Tetrabaena socialis TaxID=47790 RepID=A0A2J7ZNM5_9CHLO|nr:hypothetical protein TSOC_012204 [Tetrabaena socialis]|eukprot:PNH01871.1 hypothetical protein TSOC_012204 [Tetrabaena socialis]